MNLFKRAIRKTVKGTKKWLSEAEKTQRSAYELSLPEFSYRWLNQVLFPQILVANKRHLRPNYLWGVLQGVNLARALNVERVSLIEFGVAGGNGLVSLEKTAEALAPFYDVKIDIYGFDTGRGLPKPSDYRDLPNLYQESRYQMDVEKLQSRLKRSELVLGMVEETIEAFIQAKPAPVAFVSIDLDLYTGTKHALKLLTGSQEILLPRIHFYLDDIMGFSCSEFTGERLAVNEFNAMNELRKISPIYGLKYLLPAPYQGQMWLDQMYMGHIFDHHLYNCFDGLADVWELELVEK